MAVFYNSSNTTTGSFIWNNVINTGSCNTFTLYPYIPSKKEEEMQTSVVLLPEGYVGIVSRPIDGKAVPIARTKAFPCKEIPDVKAEARAKKAAQRLALKIVRKFA